MRRHQALYILDSDAYELVYGPEERADVARLVDVIAPPQTRQSIAENPKLLAQADVILSGWGAPTLSDNFLDHAPRLRAFFYGGGALGSIISPAVWDRGLLLTCAIQANSVP